MGGKAGGSRCLKRFLRVEINPFFIQYYGLSEIKRPLHEDLVHTDNIP